MILARFLSKIFNKEGIILVDSQGQKYICGEISNKEKPLIAADLALSCLSLLILLGFLSTISIGSLSFPTTDNMIFDNTFI